MRNPLLVPDLRELIQAGEEEVLRDFFSDHHPAHTAEILEDFEASEGDKLFGLLTPRSRAEVLSYLGGERQVEIIERMIPADAASLLRLMSHDERADLVKKLDEERVERHEREILRQRRHDLAIAEHLFDALERDAADLFERLPLLSHAERARFEARHVEEVLHETIQAIRFLQDRVGQLAAHRRLEARFEERARGARHDGQRRAQVM